MSDVPSPNSSSITVPELVTFEQAIALSQALLSQVEQGQISDSDLQAAIATLVSSENGARGFFVTYLTGESALADQPSEAVIQALQTSPAQVSELLVKNLAMSTAMAMTHRRAQREAMAQGSDRVRSRTLSLIQTLQLPDISEKAAQLQHSARTGEGVYEPFLQRWSYDAEQRLAIETVLQTVLDKSHP